MSTSDYVARIRERIGHELLVMPGVAAVVRDERGRILLQCRADDGQWSLPAGAVDPGERPAEAVVREVWEETGLRVEPVRITGVVGGRDFRHRYPNGDESEYLVVVFECRVTGGTLHERDGESAGFRWAELDEMPQRLTRYPRELFERADGPAFFRAPERLPWDGDAGAGG